MSTITEKTLYDALVYCRVPELPEIENGKDEWIKAIAKVVKRDGSECYVYVEKDLNLDNVVKKDFGPICSIVKVLAYYPLTYLDKAYLPYLGKGAKARDSKLQYLMEIANIDFSNLTDEELDKKVLAYAINHHLTLEDKI